MARPPHYAALGSSFAAGPGISPIIDQHAMRSGRNYPHVLAERLDAHLTDVTISGATTATILDTPQITVTGVRFPPQLRLLSESADLVTITAGGNDLSYAGSMLYTAWRHVHPNEPLTTMMAPQFADGIPAPTAKDIDDTAAGLVETVPSARTGMGGRALPVRAPRRRPPRTTGLGSISRNDHGRCGVRDHRCRRLPASRSRRLTRRYRLDRCSSPQRVAGGGTDPYTRNGRAGKAGRHFADGCLKGASNGWFFRSWRPRRLAAVPSRSWSGGRHLCGARCSCSSLCSCLSWHRSSYRLRGGPFSAQSPQRRWFRGSCCSCVRSGRI